jgi:hypothetical protein
MDDIKLDIDTSLYEDFDFKDSELEYLDDEGNFESKNIEIDHISLNDDLDMDDGIPTVEITMEQYENGEIICPFTESDDLFRMSENMFASVETQQPFYVLIVDCED